MESRGRYIGELGSRVEVLSVFGYLRASVSREDHVVLVFCFLFFVQRRRLCAFRLTVFYGQALPQFERERAVATVTTFYFFEI